MIVRRTLIVSIVVFLIFVTAEARRTSSSRKGSGGWGWGSRSSSRTTARPRLTQPPQPRPAGTQSGSTPNKIGWNVPDANNKQANNGIVRQTQTHTQASAPSNTHGASQGYNPSSGQGYNPSSGQAYNPTIGKGYNPPLNQGYNPSPGQGYNPSVGGYNHGYQTPGAGAYNPMGHGYNQPSYGHPSYGQPSYGQPSYGGQPYSPSFSQVPQQQTILLPSSQPYKPGIGQIAKEAFVFAGVSAGVNAAVSRLLPGGIYGHRESAPSGGGGVGAGGVTHTQITYNNYYNNQSAPTDPANANANSPAAQPPPVQPIANAAAPNAAPAPAAAAEPTQNAQTSATNNASPTNDGKSVQSSSAEGGNNPNPLGFITSNEDIKKLSEDLFSKDVNNAFKYITINLQGQKKDDSVTDDASDPLLDVKSEAYDISTIKSVLNLHNDYELDVKVKENLTPEKREKESALLDNFLKTDVLQGAMKFLANKGYIPDDPYEFKDTLKRVWFSQFKRIDGDASSSGFETVYLAEQFDSDIIGLHNWIYYAKQEAEKKIDYLGYIKEEKFGDKAAIVKLRSKVNGFVQPVTTIFVGTSPELEMALYTLCFFARPNVPCPMSFGGKEFMIIANRVNYFGKDILVSAFPEI